MTSTYFDMTAASGVMKELYYGQVPENLVYKNNPALAMIEKKTDAVGKNIPVPLIYGVSQGRSATFANALAQQSSLQATEFLVTRASDYSIATITQETLLSAKDKGAFIDAMKQVGDGCFRSATLSASTALYRSGTGTLGSGTISSNVVTLATITDIVNFELNMALQASASDGGASITSDATIGYIIAINRGTGTFTVSTTLGGSAGTPTGWTGTMYFRVAGDNNAKMKGFEGWIPASDPSATAFFGVDRTADLVRLSGIRYDGSSQPIEEALVDAAGLAAREGGTPDTCFVSFGSYTNLEKALGSKVQYVDLKQGEIAFRGIRVNGPNSEIKVVPDRSCPAQVGWLLDMSTWKLLSVNEVPHLFRYADGLETLRVYNQDAAEMRVGYYGQVACNAPGWNSRVKLSA